MSAATAVGHACGKLILVGEHAVVYGHPALAMGLDLGTTVRLRPIDAPTRLHSHSGDQRLDRAIRLVLPSHGFEVHISSNLPVGCGMGSSAALAVALVRAHAASAGEVLGLDEEFRRSLAIEEVFHGTPSGLDNSVAARGGVLRYRRGPPPSYDTLQAPGWQGVVLETGVAGNTAELVASVRAAHPSNRGILERIGSLVLEAEAVLDQPKALGPLLNENHELLRALGVSTPRLDQLVDLALEHGALGAKLSGAGGGGIVWALVDDPHPLLDAAAARGITAHRVRPGGMQ